MVDQGIRNNAKNETGERQLFIISVRMTVLASIGSTEVVLALGKAVIGGAGGVQVHCYGDPQKPSCVATDGSANDLSCASDLPWSKDFGA